MTKNKFLHGILAAVLTTLPIGAVYAFSLFSSSMATICGVTLGEMQWAFSLSIFFLGMGAAFGGPIVEKNPKRAILYAMGFFVVGNIITAIGLFTANYWLILIGYGVFNGIGQGIGYLSPVKTLMLWFPNHKGLASSVSIVSFGLGSTLCTFIYSLLSNYIALSYFFVVIAIVYGIMMWCGSYLIQKPDQISVNTNTNCISKNMSFSYLNMFKDRRFWQSWLFMFLNISAGLALIGCSANIFKDANIEHLTVTLLMFAGLFNGGFRLIFAWISDILKKRLNIWLIISFISAIILTTSSIYYPFIGIAILFLNATYGGGFSTLPSVLSETYDNTCLSRVHGVTLSAWAFAGLVGNNFAIFIYSLFGSFWPLILILVVIHILNLINVLCYPKNN
jgi:OFA family oxalate/formate antiporter-like MFS transporter